MASIRHDKQRATASQRIDHASEKMEALDMKGGTGKGGYGGGGGNSYGGNNKGLPPVRDGKDVGRRPRTPSYLTPSSQSNRLTETKQGGGETQTTNNKNHIDYYHSGNAQDDSVSPRLERRMQRENKPGPPNSFQRGGGNLDVEETQFDLRDRNQNQRLIKYDKIPDINAALKDSRNKQPSYYNAELSNRGKGGGGKGANTREKDILKLDLSVMRDSDKTEVLQYSGAENTVGLSPKQSTSMPVSPKTPQNMTPRPSSASPRVPSPLANRRLTQRGSEQIYPSPREGMGSSPRSDTQYLSPRDVSPRVPAQAPRLQPLNHSPRALGNSKESSPRGEQHTPSPRGNPASTPRLQPLNQSPRAVANGAPAYDEQEESQGDSRRVRRNPVTPNRLERLPST